MIIVPLLSDFALQRIEEVRHSMQHPRTVDEKVRPRQTKQLLVDMTHAANAFARWNNKNVLTTLTRFLTATTTARMISLSVFFSGT